MAHTILFGGSPSAADEGDLLQATNEDLAMRLLERTEELETANEELQAEIHERMRVEEELEKSNLFLRSILDSSASISIITTDPDGLITYWNIGAQKLFGYKASEVVGVANMRILIPPDEPGTAAALTTMRTNALTTKQSYRREVIECTKSGEKVWINLAISPRLDENGACTGILGIGENITARKLAERELFTTRGRLEQLLDTSLVIIYSRRAEGDFGITFISNNVFALLGCDPADFVDDPGYWASRLHPDDRHLAGETSRQLSDEHYVLEYRLRDGKEMYRWLRDETRLVRDDMGEPLEIVGSWVDITEQKKAEQRLRSSLEEKEVMLREIHHRVKNNLQVIIALMGLQAESVSDKKTQEMLTELQARARAMSLVHETLYQSHTVASVNLSTYIKNLTGNVMQTHGIGVGTALQVNAEEVLVGLDAAIPCGLIINELVTNALKYAFPRVMHQEAQDRAKNEIVVSVRRNEEAITLTVSDNGVGMPEGIDWTKSKSLGLRLVNILAKNQLRGTLEVDQTRGTSFSITFCERHSEKTKVNSQLQNHTDDKTAENTRR